jgi:hypothetical protein
MELTIVNEVDFISLRYDVCLQSLFRRGH